VEGEGFVLGAVGELHGVLGVPLVEHVHGEGGHRLAASHCLEDAGNALVRARHVVRGDSDRPLLATGRLLPVGVGELLEGARHLGSLGLELLG
jgi:hypothetical protein